MTAPPAGWGISRTVLRLHRTALIVWVAFMTATLVCLVWLNVITADSVRAEAASCPADPLVYCPGRRAVLYYSSPMGWISTLVYHSFWAVAAWAGGALIGRELENGTARLAWTQGVTPTRWLAVKLALPALALTVAGAVFVPVYHWAWSANRDLMSDDWNWPDEFAARGPAVIAYGLCALAVGTLTALLLRRSLPALGVSVALMVLINRYVERHREDLWPPVTVSSEAEFELLPHNDIWQVPHSSRAYAAYHPQSHFWPLHLVETGILLALAALATTAAFLLLRRRATPTGRP